MSTDTGHNLMDPGETPGENLNFLFFCSAVIQAVNKHQGLLRAAVANIGQDHRLGANEAPPAIISVFLGAELDKAFEGIASGDQDHSTPGTMMELGTPVLPRLPKHGGDRNRTSPFAFTGNKFEFRALGSSMSLGFPNTVLNTIVAEAVDELADTLKAKLDGGASLSDAVMEVVRDSYSANKQIVFGGDNYSEEWHQEAEQRGLKNLRTTPDALPEVISEPTVAAFENYHVLSRRELESRYEVWAEQYAVKANIEAETTSSIARTLLLPAGLRHQKLVDETGVEDLQVENREMVQALVAAIGKLEEANQYPDGIEDDVLELARYARDHQLAAMADVREAADKLEQYVADDLWPLPKYSEMLFIK
jgi:glutamine synthetase